MLDDYLILRAILEDGSFTAAAKTLGVTQSYLSQCVRKMEERCHGSVLSRRSRPPALTEMGRVYFESRREIHRIEEKTRTYCEDFAHLAVGRLRIASNGERTNAVLMPAVAAFHRAYPGITLDFSLELHLEEIPAALTSGEADIGVLYEYLLTPELDAYPLFPERYLLAVPDAPAFRNFGSPFNEAGKYPLLSETDAGALRKLPLLQTYRHHERTETLGRALGFPVKEFDATVLQVGTRISFVASGICAAICQERILATYAARSACRYASLEGVLPVQTMVLAWHRTEYRSKASREFCRIALETIRESGDTARPVA